MGFDPFIYKAFVLLHQALTIYPGLMAEQGDAQPPQPMNVEMVETASKVVTLIGMVVALAILLPIAFMIYKRVILDVAATRKQALASRNPAEEAARLMARRDFRGAAAMYLKAEDFARAAGALRQAGDLARAAELYEHKAGDLEKAAELYLKAGESLRAAGVFVKLEKYVEAAKIFKNKGDGLRAAQALEMLGNHVAAAREYADAGEFVRAAKLFQRDGLHAEAAEMYGRFLADESPADHNLNAFYTYAANLALAGETERARDIYLTIYTIDPGYKEIAENLRALGVNIETDITYAEYAPVEASRAGSPPDAPSTPPPVLTQPTPIQKEDGLSSTALHEQLAASCEEDEARPCEGITPGETTIRGMIRSGNLEPKYSLKLWLQILKTLAESHNRGVFYGHLSPDDIFIDMQNNVRLREPLTKRAAYAAPDVRAGAHPHPKADIYSMGVILYEMLAGSLDEMGSKRPSQVNPTVPVWLDALVKKCSSADAATRFGSMEEISKALATLASRSGEATAQKPPEDS